MGRRSKHSSRNKSDFDQLVQQLQPLGYHVRRMEADGNCLFRSFGDQMDGHPDNHQRFRDHCCQFMIENIEDFEPFYCHNSKDRQPRTFETYVKTMKLPGVWGSQLELMALCRRFNINAIVHQWGRQPYLMGNAPQTARCIQLTFHDGNHYNSVRIASDESLENPVQHVTLQQLKGPALTEEDARKRDDVPQVQGAKKIDPSEAAPLNEEGYSSVQKSKNEDHMKHYIRRLICTLGLVMDEGVPDHFARAGDVALQRAEAHSARLNEAVRVLRSPLKRATYWMELHGVKVLDEDQRMDDMETMMEVMELSEELDEAQSQNDADRVADAVRSRARKVEGQLGEFLRKEDWKGSRKLIERLQMLTRLEERANDWQLSA